MTKRFQSFEIYKVMKQVLDKKTNRLLNVDECTELLNELNEENQQVFNSISNRIKFYKELRTTSQEEWVTIIIDRMIEDLEDLRRLKNDTIR